MSLDPGELLIVAGVFFVAGTVKGVIGLGLPTVSLALLTLAFDLPTAMALLLLPSLFTNLWQAHAGTNPLPLLRRLWPFLLPACLAVALGGLALTRIQLEILTALLGALLVAYAAANLGGWRLRLRPADESWAGPLAGFVNGVLTGMTGSFVVPGVLYLQALGLPRASLLQAMGILFTLSTLALGFTLQGSRLLTFELGALSALGLVPALAGMAVGRAVGRRLSEALFRRVFFGGLLLLGAWLAFQQV